MGSIRMGRARTLPPRPSHPGSFLRAPRDHFNTASSVQALFPEKYTATEKTAAPVEVLLSDRSLSAPSVSVLPYGRPASEIAFRPGTSHSERSSVCSHYIACSLSTRNKGSVYRRSECTAFRRDDQGILYLTPREDGIEYVNDRVVDLWRYDKKKTSSRLTTDKSMGAGDILYHCQEQSSGRELSWKGDSVTRQPGADQANTTNTAVRRLVRIINQLEGS